MNKISEKKVIELFGNTIIPFLQSNEEVPKINFIFSDEGIEIFREVSKNPLVLENNRPPSINFENIMQLINQPIDSNTPTIIVKHSKRFFLLLTHLINVQMDLNNYYEEEMSPTFSAINIMKKIWLRMGAEDFDNIEQFLQKQIDFIENREFDNPYHENRIDNYDNITYQVQKCTLWYETSRRMYFKIYDGEKYHELPNVYYDIRKENNTKICYIYALQNSFSNQRIKSIERNLYKLNKGIEDSKVHPNFMMSLKLFVDILMSRGIYDIKVPSIQVLSYPFHQLLSMEVKKSFEYNWSDETFAHLEFLKESPVKNLNYQYELLREEYEHDKKWYNHIVNKENFISNAKTENLFNAFYQLEMIDDRVKINTLPFINSLYLEMTLTNNLLISRSK